MVDHLSIATAAARRAGDMLKAHFGMSLNIETKADRSLVTNLDKEAERIIVDMLTAAFPAYGIIGEEGGAKSRSGEYTWVIDPLDGTHNYIRGVPVYGVSIGLMRGKEFVAGVIYMPAEGDLYTAEKGGGSWKNGSRISASSCSSLEECTLLYDSGLRAATAEKIGCMGAFASRVFNVRMSGSSVRNLTFIAEGKSDLLVEFTSACGISPPALRSSKRPAGP